MNQYFLDHYAKKAQKEKFAARSVYKLKEIDAKFHIFKKIRTMKSDVIRILDLGAAPGSWSQYALRTLPSCMHIVSIDKQPISASIKEKNYSRVTILQNDFTEIKTQEKLQSLGPYHCIMSDAAPFTTGNKIVDINASRKIVESVFVISQSMLIKGGYMIAKVFEGEGQDALIKHMKTWFFSTSFYKPLATKKRSFEHYIICR